MPVAGARLAGTALAIDPPRTRRATPQTTRRRSHGNRTSHQAHGRAGPGQDAQLHPGLEGRPGEARQRRGQLPRASDFAAISLTQIGNVETAHLATKTAKGLISARTVQVDILWGSFLADCTYCEGVCNAAATTAQGLALAEASGFHVVEVGGIVKAIIEITVEVGTGTVHLKANASQLHGLSVKPSAAKTYLWRHILTGTTGTTTIVNDDPTPIASTTITGLPLGQTVGFQVAAKDSAGAGAWSVVIPASID